MKKPNRVWVVEAKYRTRWLPQTTFISYHDAVNSKYKYIANAPDNKFRIICYEAKESK